MDLTVRCACGTVQGTITGVSPASTNVTVCDCRWCQWYAQALGREDEILDQHGGTTVVLVAPDRLSFSAGHDQIACGTLSAKGPTRWFADCCKTPLANTIRPSIPFMGVLAFCIAEQPVTDAAGPVRARINSTLSGQQARDLKATPAAQIRMMLRLTGLLGAWWLRGAHRKLPFPSQVTPRRLPRPEANA